MSLPKPKSSVNSFFDLSKPLLGSLAVVCYVGDAVTSCLDNLKQLIPSKDLPRAHITILPPRPLEISIEAACQKIESALSRFGCFEVNLSHVARFPETSFIYLDIGEGSEILHAMHDDLNQGELEYEEAFCFRPHLTLGGPVSLESGEIVRANVEQAWNLVDCPRRVCIREIVCLWRAPNVETVEWVRFHSYTLTAEPAETIIAAAGITTQTC